jgi:predicted Zn finger-like uncharacterized protein
MRLTCPNCDAQYEVADNAIPGTGRDVQCSNCGHAWFQIHPDTIEAEADEAAVHGAAPVAEPAAAAAAAAPAMAAMTAPAPAHEPEVEDGPAGDDAPLGAAPRRIDENVLAVLREEAARETDARKRETAVLETQPDLGLAPVQPAAAAPAAERAPRQRDLLPDIEEINSTLRPGAEARGDEVTEEAEAAAQRRSGFRSGFLLVVAAALILGALYLAAPRIGAMVPAMARPMAAYVGAVDTFRIWLDGAVQSAVGAVRSLSGQPG